MYFTKWRNVSSVNDAFVIVYLSVLTLILALGYTSTVFMLGLFKTLRCSDIFLTFNL